MEIEASPIQPEEGSFPQEVKGLEYPQEVEGLEYPIEVEREAD